MSATRAAALFALLAIACPASAQDRARQSPSQRILRPPPVAEATPSGHFEATCANISGMSGASGSFAFVCDQPVGGRLNLVVARTYDQTGEYAVGFEQGVNLSHQDEGRMMAVATTVQTFALLKAVRPDSPQMLYVNGLYSRLASANSRPVVTSVQMR